MTGRDHRQVHPPTGPKKAVPSPAQHLRILSSIPRDKPEVITGLQKDWNAVEALVTECIRLALQTQLRAYGHQAIVEDIALQLEKPTEFPNTAHQSYIKRITMEHGQVLCAASDIRRLLTNVEFGDEYLRKLMQKAAQGVERTPDEPNLIVKDTPGDIVVTFAT
jgi:hypothetical protein